MFNPHIRFHTMIEFDLFENKDIFLYIAAIKTVLPLTFFLDSQEIKLIKIRRIVVEVNNFLRN